jgi:3-oxoacyl-[acyl-carrier-protein] synthase-3
MSLQAFDALDEACDPEADRALDSEYARKKEKNLYKVKILGVGAYRPKRVVRSEEVEALCGVESGWSGKHNVGVDTRHWADLGAGETNSFMAAAAVREACQKARVEVASLDCIINASASNERVLPDGSALGKRALGLEDCACACFSVHATCLSFVMAVDVASALIHAGRYSRVCVVSSEVASVGIDFEQPESALLLGDGAAACVLGATPRGEASAVHRAHFENHCRGLDTATLRTGTLKHPKDAWTGPKDHLFDMDGPGIVNAIREVGSAFLERVRPGLSTRLNHDLDLVVPHQASGAAMDILMAHGWPREKTVNVLASTGNCVAASTGLALYEAVESGRLKRGMKFLFCGTGGGITLGAAVLTY